MAEHYYTSNPTSKSDVQEIAYEAGGRTYRFFSDHGTFSMDRVDLGTDLLIRTILKDDPEPGPILDLGCGYGPIGLVLADQFKTPAVLMDINERAMDLARQAATANRIENVRIVTEDQLTAGGFAIAATNPPIRAGKKVVYHFFQLAYDRLQPGGVLYVVIQKKQGADSAFKELVRVFGNCETIGRQAGYHILRSER